MDTSKIIIRPMSPDDWLEVLAIYLEGLATAQATFETIAPAWDEWDDGHLSAARLVALSRDQDRLAGWCALSPVSTRSVYSGVAEVSVYVADHFRGHGVGAALLGALIKESENSGIWTLQASVFPENVASLALHLNRGFSKIGERRRIAKLNGVWRDTVLLERRSGIVGID